MLFVREGVDPLGAPEEEGLLDGRGVDAQPAHVTRRLQLVKRCLHALVLADRL